MTPTRVRLGMIGGGEGAFIGAVHRMAARLDDRYELKAGAFSRDEDGNRRVGSALGLASDRVYADWRCLLDREASLDDGAEIVTIATPNALHFPMAKAALERGFHVICEKPMTVSATEAAELCELASARHRRLFIAHPYIAYALVRRAREMVRQGQIGAIRVVRVQYAQGWLSRAVENEGSKQAAWRSDVTIAGPGGAISDIGIHAYNLLRFVSGLEVTSLCAVLSRFVPGRGVDDDSQILLKLENNARGMIWASQISVGNANALSIEIYGEFGSLVWRQENPNQLRFTRENLPTQIINRGGAMPDHAVENGGRTPEGHPEGYIEAFATLYRDIADELQPSRVWRTGATLISEGQDGLQGARFIEAAIRSSAGENCWVDLPNG